MQDILDTSAPKRPSMPTVSRELFNSGRYNVCLTRAGIVVQHHSTGTGKLLPTSHPQYEQWVTAWDALLDTDEGNALCKALRI